MYITINAKRTVFNSCSQFRVIDLIMSLISRFFWITSTKINPQSHGIIKATREIIKIKRFQKFNNLNKSENF